MSTTDLAELRRLYEAAMCVGANEMAWDEWTTAISEAADALLDAAAERDALAAKVERVRELHKSSGDAETQGYTGREYGYISPYCMGEVASDEYGVPWPCETIRAIDGAES